MSSSFFGVPVTARLTFLSSFFFYQVTSVLCPFLLDFNLVFLLTPDHSNTSYSCFFLWILFLCCYGVHFFPWPFRRVCFWKELIMYIYGKQTYLTNISFLRLISWRRNFVFVSLYPWVYICNIVKPNAYDRRVASLVLLKKISCLLSYVFYLNC